MLGGFYHGGQVIGGIDAFATDKTPVGTVISVGCAKTGEVAGKTTPTGAFPTKDYLVCDNATYNITDYPKLANYFEEAYGSKNYFGGNGTTTFAVPNWQASFPVNGVLCIKAQISSNQISLAEIDDTQASEDTVYSSAKVEAMVDGVQEEVNKNGVVEVSMAAETSYTLSYTGPTCLLAVGSGIYMLGRYSSVKNVIVNDANVSITWVSQRKWTVTNTSTSSTGKPLKAFAAGVSLVQATT